MPEQEAQQQEATGSEEAQVQETQQAEGQSGEQQQSQEKEQIQDELSGLSEEQRERIIQEAIKNGRVVDYETRFKPIYGALKNTEREFEAFKRSGGQQGGQQQPLSGKSKPKPEDFQDYNDYVEALTDWKVESREAARSEEAKKAKEQEMIRRIDDQILAAETKDPEFREKAYLPEGLMPLLFESDHLADFGYYFAEKPTEVRRFMSMDPYQRAREIGKLEAGFARKPPPQRTTTKAPNPTKPVGGKETATKREEDMSTDEWFAARKTGQI